MFQVESSIEEGETLELSGNSSLVWPGCSRKSRTVLMDRTGEKNLGQIMESFVGQREENLLDLREKQPKGWNV